MLPRLIATDLDGTFLDVHGDYDHARLDALLVDLDRRGSRLVLATGDPLDHVYQLFGDLKHADLLTYVVEDGAMIVSGTGTVLQQNAMPATLSRQAIAWIQTAPLLAENFLIACAPQAAYTELAATSDRFAASQVYYPSLTSVADLLAVTAPVLKLDVTWLRNDVSAQVAAFNHTFAGQLVGTSSGLGGMNVTLPTVSKGAALAFLQQRWQLTTDQLAAFGDSGNDLSMLQLVGQGIAIANAAPEVLTAIPRHTQRTNVHPAVMDQIADWLHRD